MKDLLQRLTGGSAETMAAPEQARLALAAFGKHPGWDDHIPGIGVETETLARVKQALYVSGIGGQIDSGAWEKLEPEKRLAGYDHTFLWLRPGHAILGQLWSSTDGKGRAKYPMVLCVDGEAVSPGFMLACILPGLERLREACRTAASAEQVTGNCRAAQEQLRVMLDSESSRPAETRLSSEARRQFLERRDLGPERLGLLRALHELGIGFRGSAGGRGSASEAKATSRSCHLRLPLTAGSRSESLLLWSEFLRCAVPAVVPLLLISRGGVEWIDVVAGEPMSDDLFCLQASPKAMPLVTEIPYELSPELKLWLSESEGEFLGVAAGPAASAPVGSKDDGPQAKPATRKPLFLIGVGVLVLSAAAIALWLPRGVNSAKTQPSAAVASLHANQKTQVAQPAPSAAAQQAEAEARAAAQAAAEFQKVLDLAQADERAGNYTNALAGYQKAQNLRPDDAEVRNKVQAVKSKAEEQVQQAKTQADAAAQAAAGFQKVLGLAQADERAGNYTNALAGYQNAQRLRPDDTGVRNKVEAVKPKAEEQVWQAKAQAEAAARAAAEFQKVLGLAQADERAGNFTNALAGYQKAQRLRPDDAEVRKKVEAVQPKAAAQVKQAEADAAAAETKAQFQKVLTAAQGYEQAGNFTNALERYQAAQKLRPDDAEVKNKIEAVKPKALEQMAPAENPAKRLQQLDSEFEVLLVWFGILKPDDPRIRTPEAHKERPLSGTIGPQQTYKYLGRVGWLESEYKKGAWLNQNDRQKYLNKLKETIRYRE